MKCAFVFVEASDCGVYSCGRGLGQTKGSDQVSVVAYRNSGYRKVVDGSGRVDSP